MTRLRHGLYVDRDIAARLDPVATHRLLVAHLFDGGGEASRPGPVLSHVSAAIMHGLPVPAQIGLSAVHLTWPGSPGRARSIGVHPHRAVIDPEDMVMRSGFRMTGVARTVYDIARSEDQTLGVSVADAALRAGLCGPGDFTELHERVSGRPGSHIAREVMCFADPRSSGVPQSTARVQMARAGLPSPQLSVVLPGLARPDLGQVDFEFCRAGVAATVIAGVGPGSLERINREDGTNIVLLRLDELTVAGADQLARAVSAAFALAGHRWRRSLPRLLPGAALTMWNAAVWDRVTADRPPVALFGPGR